MHAPLFFGVYLGRYIRHFTVQLEPNFNWIHISSPPLCVNYRGVHGTNQRKEVIKNGNRAAIKRRSTTAAQNFPVDVLAAGEERYHSAGAIASTDAAIQTRRH